MDGVHDMGGMHGFGPVVEAGADLAYHERWEPRVFAISMLVALKGLSAGPGGRAVRERMDPDEYLAASYYERWLFSTVQGLLSKGTISPGEVEAAIERLQAVERLPESEDRTTLTSVRADLRSVRPMAGVSGDVQFKVGQAVRVKRMHPAGHTRCPRYVRGVVGHIEAVRGLDPLPDRAVYGEHVSSEPVYAVTFSSDALWGPTTEPQWTVALDLWESYLVDA